MAKSKAKSKKKSIKSTQKQRNNTHTQQKRGKKRNLASISPIATPNPKKRKIKKSNENTNHNNSSSKSKSKTLELPKHIHLAIVTSITCDCCIKGAHPYQIEKRIKNKKTYPGAWSAKAIAYFMVRKEKLIQKWDKIGVIGYEYCYNQIQKRHANFKKYSEKDQRKLADILLTHLYQLQQEITAAKIAYKNEELAEKNKTDSTKLKIKKNNKTNYNTFSISVIIIIIIFLFFRSVILSEVKFFFVYRYLLDGHIA